MCALLNVQTSCCCTSILDKYDCLLSLWDHQVPDCTLLYAIQKRKKVSWRKFWCKHTSTIFLDSKVRQDNRNPSATHMLDSTQNLAQKSEWDDVWNRPRPSSVDSNPTQSNLEARWRAFDMYNQSRDDSEDMISHQSFLLQTQKSQLFIPEQEAHSKLSEQEPSTRPPNLLQSETLKPCTVNSTMVDTSSIQNLQTQNDEEHAVEEHSSKVSESINATHKDSCFQA